MTKLLVIDDDPEICDTMKSLAMRMRIECESAHTLAEGLRRVASMEPDVVFLDVRLPDGDGLTVISEIKESASSPEIIILTGQGDPDGAELAIQGGAWDYLLKPSPIKRTMLSLERALQYRAEKRSDKTAIALDLDEVVGRSPRMKRCFDLVAKAARGAVNVLLCGETGTGKELLARTIHLNSPRRNGPFVAVDCASLTESLVEGALFGHKKGAFTGADSDRVGLVKLADRGTLFLDEIGELPVSMQKSFLRVLQEKRFRPLGGAEEMQSDFRLIAATNRDLEKMAEYGEFRRDLLFRIKTLRIELPLLRERKEDIRSLAMFRADKLAQEYGLPEKSLDPEFFETLLAYDWPGNVRELFNVVERAFTAAGREKTLYAMHLPQEIRIKVAKQSLSRDRCQPLPPAMAGEARTGETPAAALPQGLSGDGLPTLKSYKDTMEKRYLSHLLAHCAGDLGDMLLVSGLSRSHFYALLKKHGIPAEFATVRAKGE